MTSIKIILTGTIKNLQVHKTSKSDTMAFASFESENNDKIEVVFFAWKEYEAKIKEGIVITLCGKFGDNVHNHKTGKNGLAVSSVLSHIKKTEKALKANWVLINSLQTVKNNEL